MKKQPLLIIVMRVSVTAYLKDEAKEIFYLVFNGMRQPKQKTLRDMFYESFQTIFFQF